MYFQSVNASSSERIKLLRLAFDASLSSFAGRQRLYEQFYTGDPMRTQALLFNMYDKDTHIERIRLKSNCPGTAHLMEFGLMPTVLLSTAEQGHHDNLLKQENKFSIRR